MRKHLSILITLLFLATAAFADSLSIQTRSGTVTLPTAEEIASAINELENNKGLSEQEKNKLSAIYNKGSEELNRIKTLEDKQSGLQKLIKNSKKELMTLSKKINQEQQQKALTDDEVRTMSEKEIDDKIKEFNSALTEANIDLETSSGYKDDIQTLPEKSQSTVTKNNDITKRLTQRINDNGDVNALENRIRAASIYAANLENNLYKSQLSNLSTLQDLASLSFSLASMRYERFDANLKKLNTRQKELAEKSSSTETTLSEEIIKSNNELAAVDKDIKEFRSYIQMARKELAKMQTESQAIYEANTKVEQIDISIHNQISSLNKGLVLSRLLNKHSDLLPKVKMSYDIDEMIANLNIYIYEIRERASQINDIFGQVEKVIQNNPKLSVYRDQILGLYSQRKQVYSTLYQILADALNQVIETKVKYENYQRLYKKISADISEQLFWIRSNVPLSKEFFRDLLQNSKYELEGLFKKLSDKDYQLKTFKNLINIIIPFIVLGLCVFIFRGKIRKLNDDMARRLDTASDSIFLTPVAILYNMLLMIPHMVWMIVIGAFIICITTDTPDTQQIVILNMLLHIFVFVFFIQILKPNALVQRHFSVPPYKLNHFSNILSSVWVFVLPLLIFANVAEADSTDIYSDLASFFIVLISCICLLGIGLWLLYRNFSHISMSSTGYVISCLAGIIITALGAFAVASGYLYTVVKLTNRIAYSFYIILGYFLLSQTVHRMLYVYTNQKFAQLKSGEADDEDGENDDDVSTPAHSRPTLMNLLSVVKSSASMLCSRMYNLARIGLIVVTLILLYLQWNDLASVLRYLNTLNIWSKKEFVDGHVVIKDAITVADVLFAIIILLITNVLNKNLPVLFEKMILIRKNHSAKSTSYSVKVISSYIIIGLGLIMSAGALGIKWENLQWLVAALSVGLGFGLQEIFANFVSGIILLFERQLRVGDIITLNGLSGTVSKIRIRSTTVTSFENKEVMIPNREFITSALTNWSLTSTVTKLEFNVGIAYDADVEKAKNILTGIVNRCRYITKEKGFLIYVKELASSEVTIAVEVYVTLIGDRKLTMDYLSRETLSHFASAGIEIPFNQMDIHLKTLEKAELIEELRKGLFQRNVDDK